LHVMVRELFRWSSNLVADDAAFSVWKSELSERGIDMRCRPTPDEAFHSNFVHKAIGPLRLTSMQCSAVTGSFRLTSGSSRYALKYIRKGQYSFNTDQGEIIATPGNMVILDIAKIKSFSIPDDGSCIWLSLPENWAESRVRNMERHTFRVLGTDSVWARLLISSLEEIAKLQMEDCILDEDVIVKVISGFLEILFAESAMTATSYKASTFWRILRTMEAHHQNADLSPSDIAALHSMSKRNLHAVFAAVGTGFRRELVRIRLEQAKHLLAHSRFQSATVGEIAIWCGFSDPTYFSRCFRAAYGTSPGRWRTSLPLNS